LVLKKPENFLQNWMEFWTIRSDARRKRKAIAP